MRWGGGDVLGGKNNSRYMTFVFCLLYRPCGEVFVCVEVCVWDIEEGKNESMEGGGGEG